MYQALAKGTHYLIASSWSMLHNYYHHFTEGTTLAHRNYSPRLLLVELAFECELSLLDSAGLSSKGITLVTKLQKHSSRFYPFSLGHIKETSFSNHNENQHVNAWLEVMIERP